MFNYDKFLEDWNNYNPNVKIRPKGGIPPKYTKDPVDCDCSICNGTFESTPYHLRLAIKRNPTSKGCKVCLQQGVRKSKDDIYTLEIVSQILQENNSRLTILEELPKHKFKCHCSICNQDIIISKYSAMKSKACPVCCGKKIIPGVNDLKTTDPEIASYFISEEYITTHAANTHKKGEVKCPICGRTKFMIPKNLRTQGFGCQYCSDGVSYPNKFIREVLNQLPVSNIISEYSPDWIKPKRYDVYFEYNMKKYIIEMDGEFHFTEKLGRKPLQELKKIDNYKEEMANNHNIEVIRIESLESSRDYLKERICSSKVNSILDLSVVDWNKCAEIASSNLLKKACEIYSNTLKSSKDIAEELGLSQSTIIKYLTKGTQIGLCNYTIQEGSNRSLKRGTYVLDMNKNLVLVASCIKEALKELEQKYAISFNYRAALQHIKNKQTYKDLYFINENEYNYSYSKEGFYV